MAVKSALQRLTCSVHPRVRNARPAGRPASS